MAYEYTRPRGPIAAMYSSPGPVYQLPTLTGARTHDPRSVHGRGPTWIFGIRHGKLTEDCSPGPATLLPDFKVTRFGKDGTAVYSLYSRPRTPRFFTAPGPGAYSPEKAGPSAAPASPRFSFGSRTRLRSADCNPAPNRYSLPCMLGRTVESGRKQGPFWSQNGRTKNPAFDESARKTPGPGSHNPTDCALYKSRAPSFTLKPRLAMVSDSTTKPGPGAHSPERVVLHKPNAPSFSFGIRHSDYTAPLIVETLD